MEKADILSKKEIKRILNLIRAQWGCSTEHTEQLAEYVFLKSARDKIYVASRDVFSFPMGKVRISRMGLYFGELHKNALRLSIEGSQLVGRTASKNIIGLSDTQLEQWIRGADIALDAGKQREAETGSAFVLIKNKEDFFGCGSYSKDRKEIMNYYPKIRRVKYNPKVRKVKS